MPCSEAKKKDIKKKKKKKLPTSDHFLFTKWQFHQVKFNLIFLENLFLWYNHQLVVLRQYVTTKKTHLHLKFEGVLLLFISEATSFYFLKGVL